LGAQVHQLAALVHGRLEQLRAHQHAALEQSDAELQQLLLDWYVEHAARAAGGDPAGQLAAAREYKNAELLAYCHAALMHIATQIRAYEYLFLKDYTGLDLERLRSRRMSGGEYLQFLEKATSGLQTAFVAAASDSTNAGGTCFSHATFELVELPAAAKSFVETGILTLDIPLPPESSYYGVIFVDVRAFLVGLPAGIASVKVNLVKAGSSSFKDEDGRLHRFTHDETTPAIQFSYDSNTCAVGSSSDPRLAGGNRGSVASSLGTTLHPLYTRFASIFGASISETRMRPNPRWEPRGHPHPLLALRHLEARGPEPRGARPRQGHRRPLRVRSAPQARKLWHQRRLLQQRWRLHPTAGGPCMHGGRLETEVTSAGAPARGATQRRRRSEAVHQFRGV
jgi:hypothetical protein